MARGSCHNAFLDRFRGEQWTWSGALFSVAHVFAIGAKRGKISL